MSCNVMLFYERKSILNSTAFYHMGTKFVPVESTSQRLARLMHMVKLIMLQCVEKECKVSSLPATV